MKSLSAFAAIDLRENKDTKSKEVVYQSMKAEQREWTGIEKMLTAAGIQADEKLIKFALRLNSVCFLSL